MRAVAQAVKVCAVFDPFDWNRWKRATDADAHQDADHSVMREAVAVERHRADHGFYVGERDKVVWFGAAEA